MVAPSLGRPARVRVRPRHSCRCSRPARTRTGRRRPRRSPRRAGDAAAAAVRRVRRDVDARRAARDLIGGADRGRRGTSAPPRSRTRRPAARPRAGRSARTGRGSWRANYAATILPPAHAGHRRGEPDERTAAFPSTPPALPTSQPQPPPPVVRADVRPCRALPPVPAGSSPVPAVPVGSTAGASRPGGSTPVPPAAGGSTPEPPLPEGHSPPPAAGARRSRSRRRRCSQPPRPPTALPRAAARRGRLRRRRCRRCRLRCLPSPCRRRPPELQPVEPDACRRKEVQRVHARGRRQRAGLRGPRACPWRRSGTCRAAGRSANPRAAPASWRLRVHAQLDGADAGVAEVDAPVVGVVAAARR